MASCYGSISAPLIGTSNGQQDLPIRTALPDGTRVEIDFFRESEHKAGHDLLNGAIEEGLSWPFEEVLDMAAFRAYFLSHAAFVVRATPPPHPADPRTSTTRTPPFPGAAGSDARRERTDDTEGGDGGKEGSLPDGLHCGSTTAMVETVEMSAAVEVTGGSSNRSCSGGENKAGALQQAEQANVWGVFYIKPNFPGRCSHVCNGGFITDPRRRRRGVARLMGHAFLRLARDLGYKASYFNLVFRTNEASLRLWRGLGFTELAVVPKAGRLRGIDGLVDASQFYYDIELLRESDLPEDFRRSTGIFLA